MALGVASSNLVSHPINIEDSKNLKTYINLWRPWLNWIEFRTSDPTVIGSNPIGRTIFDINVCVHSSAG